MEIPNPQSKQSIYFNISYIIANEWPSNPMERLDFQKLLAQNQLDFPQSRAGLRDFTLVRTEPSHLLVKVASLGPRVSNLSLSSERPAHTLDFFVKEADTVCSSFHEIWLKKPTQIIQCGATIRHLYSCEEHAFKYLWEHRLDQDPQDFSFLGKRPVLGGGLRLIMPPIKEPDPIQIEIKIESFFQESKKIFIETVFVWPQPRLLPKNDKFDPANRLTKVEKYATSKVWEFLTKPTIQE